MGCSHLRAALLFESCSVSVKRALLRAELGDPPRTLFDVTSDACLADVDRAGTGGFRHGLFWFYEVSEDSRPYLTIPVLEFLAVGCGLLAFLTYLRGASRTGTRGPDVRILLRTDALTSVLALPASSANAEVMQEVDHHLRATAEWETLFFLLAVAHLYGDCNPAADFISRQRWPELRQLCALLGFRPRQVPLSPSALAPIDTAISAAKRQHSCRAQGSSAPSPEAGSAAGRMRISTASAARVGYNSLAAQRRHETQLSLRQETSSPLPSAQPPPLLSPVRDPSATVARRIHAESALRSVGHPYATSARALPPAPTAAGNSTAGADPPLASLRASPYHRGSLRAAPPLSPRPVSSAARR